MNTDLTAHDPDVAHDHDGGLAIDLAKLLPRRQLFRIASAASLIALVGCGSESASGATDTGGTAGAATTPDTATASTTAGTTDATSATTASNDECTVIPEETAGPYPGDGSNGQNVLTEADVVRSDIRSSIGSASGVADGVELRVSMTIVVGR